MHNGIFKYIHNTQQEDIEALQSVADYFFGLESAHADFKPTTKFSRVTGRIRFDEQTARLRDEVPDIRTKIESVSESTEDSVNKHDSHDARMFLGRIFSCVMSSKFSLVPRAEGDDKEVKQTYMDIIKSDPIVAKAALRYWRSSLGAEVAKYMKRLIVLQPELINNSIAMQEDYFDQFFEGRTFDKQRFFLKF